MSFETRYDKVVSAVTVYDPDTNRILLIRRAQVPEEPENVSFWSFLTETYEPDEDEGSFSACAIRGAAEELSLSLSADSLNWVGTYPIINNKTNRETLLSCYVVIMPSAEDLTFEYQEEEVSDHCWMEIRPAIQELVVGMYKNHNALFLRLLTRFLRDEYEL